jgi:hypothetical protein
MPAVETARAAGIQQSAFGGLMLLAFSSVQVADGYFTYLGVRAYGVTIEANPLIAWYIGAFGPATALVGAKTLAVACGLVLYLAARHRAIGLLTLGYLGVSIWPWSRLLLH